MSFLVIMKCSESCFIRLASESVKKFMKIFCSFLVEQELMTKQEMNLLVAVALDRVLGEEAPVVRANMLRQVIQEVDRKGK